MNKLTTPSVQAANGNNRRPSFQAQTQAGLSRLIAHEQNQAHVSDAGDANTLRIDLHCHDHNSDIPDETLGRLLRLPETWLPTEDLVKILRKRRADVVTVTNHNNARSIWHLQDQGVDVLPAAEFSVTFAGLPSGDVGVHVLTFGITPQDETELNARRKDAYRFLEYTCERDLPTSLAHPLHFHSPSGMPPQELMDLFALCFERFEGLNGQRNAWQNALTCEWVRGMTPERLETWGRRFGIKPDTFCRDPYHKRITGGSDCHFGLFAGTSGTALHAPNWRQDKRAPSQIALEALRRGDMAPYGAYCGDEKLMAAFLDYFCQAALRMQDPGLVRMLLHRGTPGEKLLGYGIANGLLELRRHRLTSRFLQVVEEGFRGKRPGFFTTLMVSKAYRPALQGVDAIAKARDLEGPQLAATLNQVLPEIFSSLWQLFGSRITAKVEERKQSGRSWPSGTDILAQLEVPVHFRSLIGNSKSKNSGKSHSKEMGMLNGMSNADIGLFMDGLPFPFLASIILGGSAFAASSVLHDKRPFVDAFAEGLGKWRHPHRALWLSDTFFDRNGVSHVLQATLQEARANALPLDFLVCDELLASEPQTSRPLDGPHLLRLKPAAHVTLPFYQEQPLRLPDLMEAHRAFAEGGYDRVICSTEAPMGLVALYLRAAFHVPAYFYVHTDWLDFAKRTLGLNPQQLDRLRRLLRAFYSRFDGVFVLNTEQRDFLTSPAMGLKPERVHVTAHWVDAVYRPVTVAKSEVFAEAAQAAGQTIKPQTKVLLFAGRLSFEKGLRDLPGILAEVKRHLPDTVLAVAGTGPAESWLREAIPDAIMLGWQDKESLARIYSAADLLVLPSWFDTFSCVLLEALRCGLPAVAYATKGPADILLHQVNGYLGKTSEELAAYCVEYLMHPEKTATFRRAAAERGACYEAEPILADLLGVIGLRGESVAGASLRAMPTAHEAGQGDNEAGLLAQLLSF